jgi:hypothetical protein
MVTSIANPLAVKRKIGAVICFGAFGMSLTVDEIWTSSGLAA